MSCVGWVKSRHQTCLKAWTNGVILAGGCDYASKDKKNVFELFRCFRYRTLFRQFPPSVEGTRKRHNTDLDKASDVTRPPPIAKRTGPGKAHIVNFIKD